MTVFVASLYSFFGLPKILPYLSIFGYVCVIFTVLYTSFSFLSILHAKKCKHFKKNEVNTKGE